jgi:murein DD-endopeptidase MepM/ murein hydrolase activator NlpD
MNVLLIAAILLYAIPSQAQTSNPPTVKAQKTEQHPTDDESCGDEESSLEDDQSESLGEEMDTTKSEYPAHDLYRNNWNTHTVNPYEIRLVDMPDTVLINLTGYCHPFFNRVTSDFGFRRSRHHYGIDIKLNTGDSVLCAFDGKVRIARRSSSYGYFVIVRHHNGLETVYAHLSRILVTPNQSVKAGELIGKGGNTGRSRGSHLHYEIRYLGVPVNPNNVIDFAKGVTLSDTLCLHAAHFNYVKEIEKIRYWTVKRGHTLGYISLKTGVSVNTLCRLNKITRKSLIRPGQRIRYT